jgi:RNase P/RNase MRP subunit p30
MHYTDLVFPRNNEEKLLEMAKRLGIKHLIFCYELKDPLLKDRGKEVAMLSTEQLTTEFAVYVTTQQEVGKAQGITKNVVAAGRPEMFDDKRVKYIINFEAAKRDDFIHHRNSGLNQVFLAAAERSQKTVLVSARQLIAGEVPPAVVLGRMMQNNTFYRKYKTAVLVVSAAREPLEMRAPRDLQNLLNL